jgi:hypothetical protein
LHPVDRFINSAANGCRRIILVAGQEMRTMTMTSNHGVPVRFTVGNWCAIFSIVIVVVGAAFGAHLTVVAKIGDIAGDVREIKALQESTMKSVEMRLGHMDRRLERIERRQMD